MSEPPHGRTWVTNVEMRALRNVQQAKATLEVLRSTDAPAIRKPSGRARAATRYERATRHIEDLQRSLERVTLNEAA